MAKTRLKCPGCFDGDSIRPSHLRWRDWLFRLIGMRSYRCMLCYQRFRAWGKPPAQVERVHHSRDRERKSA